MQQSPQGVIRNGHSTSGAQLYRCKLCLKTFQLSFQYNAAKPDTHQS
ncbi:transposase-like zinc-binding domain-containing protein, partial [Klebsiella pneumoniae]